MLKKILQIESGATLYFLRGLPDNHAVFEVLVIKVIYESIIVLLIELLND
jgi:hypothetical protein